MSKPIVVYVDAAALLGTRKSGVGHVLEHTLRELDRKIASGGIDMIVKLITPFHKLERIQSYNFTNLKIQSTFMTGKVMTLFSWLSLPFPMSIWKRGVYIFPNYRNMKLFPGSQSITYIHDVCFLMYPEMIEEKNLKHLQNHIPLWLNRTDKIVTVSETSAEEIKKYFPKLKQKIRVVLNGLDKPAVNKNDFQSIQKKYKLPQKYFLFISNIEPRKNIRSLVDAYLSIDKELQDDFGLVIIGADGWRSDDVINDISKAQLQGINIIHPHEYVSDGERDIILANAQALVMPSFHEGFSIPPLEGIMAGIPVIVSDIPVHHEIVKEYALYINPHDTSSIRNALIKMTDPETNALYKEKSRDAQKNLLPQYTWKMATSHLINIIKEVA